MRKLRIAVLIGGTGRTLKNLVDLGDQLPGRVELVMGHKADLPGYQHAKGIAKFWPGDGYTKNYSPFFMIRQFKIDLVCLAGWIKYFEIPKDFEGRVMNIHPSLLPSFGGKGMYGNKVHQAVLDRGAKISGCTVHFADNEYDNGPIILQRTVPVLDDDTTDTLAARVFAEECIAYPEAIRLYAERKVEIRGRRVVERKMTKEQELVQKAKEIVGSSRTWVEKCNALFDYDNGILAVAYPTRAEREAFVSTGEYGAILDLMNSVELDASALPVSSAPSFWQGLDEDKSPLA